MAVSTRDIASTLNDLVETNKDAEEGFRNAAENVNDSRLSTIFNECSRERAQMASDLQIEVTRIGGKPQKSGSVAGAVHRGWISIKSTFTGKSDHAILEEAERGEDAAVKAYQNALAEELPTDIRSIVQEQYQKVQKSHAEIRSLRDSTDAGRNSGLGGDGLASA